LLNLKGEVIGINRAIRTTGTTTTGQPINSGIGFAIPSNIVKRVVPVLITSGTYDYPYLGLSFRPDLTLDEVEALGLKQQMGAYIVDVTAGGPGDRAGLKAGARTTAIPGLRAGGDLVISVDGRQVKAFNDLIGYILGNKSPGDKVTLIIMRDGQQKEVSLTLGKRP
jgi:2-alkenal reductase